MFNFAKMTSEASVAKDSKASRDDLCLLLMHLISDRIENVTDQIMSLKANDWESLLNIARQHRLQVILYEGLSELDDEFVPENIMARLKAVKKTILMRHLSQRLCQKKITEILEREQICHAFLKGLWLSQHIYPNPALRPMRDIDILVEPSRAIALFERLEGIGYKRYPGNVTPLEYAFSHAHHLPPLICPFSNNIIEIHTQLIRPEKALRPENPLANVEELLSRRGRAYVEDEGFYYLDPTDTLLHLIVHAFDQHSFDNGPSVLIDLKHLLQKCQIDWEYFWGMAERGNWVNGCQLLFAMCFYYFNISTPDKAKYIDDVPEEIVRSAVLLSLQDINTRQNLAFQIKLKNAHIDQGWINILDLVWPKRHILAEFSGLPLDSLRVRLHYPVWLITKCRQRIFGEKSSNLNDNIDRYFAINTWLKTSHADQNS